MLGLVATNAFAVELDRTPTEAVTVNGEKGRLFPNGRWEYVDAAKGVLDAAKAIAGAVFANGATREFDVLLLALKLVLDTYEQEIPPRLVGIEGGVEKRGRHAAGDAAACPAHRPHRLVDVHLQDRLRSRAPHKMLDLNHRIFGSDSDFRLRFAAVR